MALEMTASYQRQAKESSPKLSVKCYSSAGRLRFL